jgi:hypothetical protein
MPAAAKEVVGAKIINIIKGHRNLMAFYNYRCDRKKTLKNIR